MNKLIFREANEERVIYKYYPNGGESFGEVEYSFGSKEARILRKADNDETGNFAHKALTKVKSVIAEEDAMPRSFTQAWY